jgi:DNA-binding NarL/FixJ family response regulator
MFGTLSFRLMAMPPEDISDDETYYPSVGQIEAAKKNPIFALLTEAQMRVFAELITGATEIQIAQRLNLAKSTVHNHAKSIYSTLGVHSRAELIRRFLDALRAP